MIAEYWGPKRRIFDGIFRNYSVDRQMAMSQSKKIATKSFFTNIKLFDLIFARQRWTNKISFSERWLFSFLNGC